MGLLSHGLEYIYIFTLLEQESDAVKLWSLDSMDCLRRSISIERLLLGRAVTVGRLPWDQRSFLGSAG